MKPTNVFDDSGQRIFAGDIVDVTFENGDKWNVVVSPKEEHNKQWMRGKSFVIVGSCFE